MRPATVPPRWSSWWSWRIRCLPTAASSQRPLDTILGTMPSQMSTDSELSVPPDLVDAAVLAAQQCGRPVAERAIEAGARLISDRGLASVTLEAVAEVAHCSIAGVQAIFGTRDRLFAAIYERYSPLRDLLGLFSDTTSGVEEMVAGFYRV